MATTPTWVAAGTLVATATNGATLSPVPPNGTTGDLLVLILQRNDTTAAPSVSGWTAVAGLTQTNSTTQSVGTYYKIATSGTGSADSPSAITFGSSTVARCAVILRFANPNPLNPIAQTTANNVASTATTVNATNITSVEDNTLAVFIACNIGARSTTNTTTNWSAGAGVTAFASQNTTVGNDLTVGYGSKTFDAAGSYLSPGIVWTTNTTTGVGMGLLFGIRSVAPPPTPGESTFDTFNTPIAVRAEASWRPIRGAVENSLVPTALTTRAQVGWAQIDLPAAAPVSNDPFKPLPTAYELPPRGRSRSRDYTWTWPSQTQLVGQDAMATGEQSTELPPRSPARQRDYTWTQSASLSVFQQLPPGAQSFELPPKAVPRSRDYTWTQEYPLQIFEELPSGKQSTDNLPPRRAARSRDYTWEYSSPVPQLIGQDSMATGVQVGNDLPPRGPKRASSLYEPGYNDTVWLQFAVDNSVVVGKSTDQTALPPKAPARSRDYTFLDQAQIPNLAGTDFMVPGVQSVSQPVLPKGRSASIYEPGLNTAPVLASVQAPFIPPPLATELPPRAVARSRDYTWLHPTDTQLIGQDAMATGAQFTELPPRKAPRGADLSTPYNLTVWLDYDNSLRIPGPGKSTDATALPPRGPARSCDYTFLHNADVQLFGQDAMVTGEQSLDLPPRTAARSRDYSWLQSLSLPIFQEIPQGQISTALPPRGPGRSSSIYEPGVNFLVGLAIQNPFVAQITELPPRGATRSKDYSFSDQAIIPQLIGQDAVNPGKSTDATALPPRGPRRSKDYTWLQPYQLHVFEQLPAGDSTLVTEGPPKGPLRLKDYTFLNVNVRYIGQDTMYAAPGEAPVYDWPNPIPYKRPLDYRMFVNPTVWFTGKPVTPGTVEGGSSLTASVLAGTSALGSVLSGTSALGSVLGGSSQTEL